MTCFISRNLLTELVDDALAEAREAELREHLAGCVACTKELQDLRRTRAMLRSLPVRRAPPDFLSKVRAKAERKSPLERISLVLAPVLRLPRPAIGGLALAASLMVAVTVAIRHDERPEGIFGYGGGVGPSAAKVVSGPAESKQEKVAQVALAETPADEAGGVLADRSKEPSDELAKLAKNQPERLDVGDGKLATKTEFKSKSDVAYADPVAGAGKGGMGRESVVSGRAAAERPSAIMAAEQVPAPAPTPAAKPGLYASTPGQRQDARVAGGERAPASEEQDTGRFAESAPEPAFDVESTTVAPRTARDAETKDKDVAGKKRSERRKEAERTNAAPSVASESGAAMGAPSEDGWSGGGSGRAGSSVGGATGDMSGSVSDDSASSDVTTPVASSSAEKTPAKVAQTSTTGTTGAAATLNARFSSGAATGPAIVAEAARTAGGKLISGTPPALGKSGASTNVVVELPVAAVASLEEALDAQGTFDIQGTPSGTRVRLRIEVVRE